MSIKEIEAAIQQLSPKEVSELSVWLADHQANLWDAQIAQDLEAGRLNELLDQVNAEYDRLLF
ncbi:MAG TPA: hypothetical protein VK074_07530 [Fodinibius sp.]|nr:hypothetical protein [Fodinibius sp.]